MWVTLYDYSKTFWFHTGHVSAIPFSDYTCKKSVVGL